MIIKPLSPLVQELDATAFTVIGNPCSDGIGGGSLRLLHAALAGAEGDFAVLAGDVSPLGRDPYYDIVSRFIERTSPLPVHVIRSNHDGPDFGEYFGHNNRAILSERFALVMLDNSERRFSAETLAFLRGTMAMVNSRNVIVAFHIPPPNRISGNSLPQAEWRNFEEAVGVWRSRISMLLCGHSHSYYEDDVDGLRLVVTGGGGARLREAERVLTPPHHALEIGVGEDGGLSVRMRPLAPDLFPVSSDETRQLLTDAYGMLCRHYVNHLFRAEEALEGGRAGFAHLRRAAAASAYEQLRVLFKMLAGELEADGIGSEFLLGIDSEDTRDVLAVMALNGVGRAAHGYEVLRGRLESRVTEGTDIPTSAYFVCGGCGMLFAGFDSPNYCPECGAPGAQYREIK